MVMMSFSILLAGYGVNRSKDQAPNDALSLLSGESDFKWLDTAALIWLANMTVGSGSVVDQTSFF